MKIVNINETWGMPVEFAAATEAECVEQMAATIRECGPESADALVEHGDLIEGIDYEVVKDPAAVALGSRRSPRKASSSRENGKQGGRPEHQYFVVPAPGYYGDTATVRSSHSTLASAQKAAGETGVVRIGHKRKGEKWLRVYEETYPLA